MALLLLLLCPHPIGGAGALSGDRRPSSVRLMSRTSALTRKPKGLGRRTFAQGYPRSHATPTPTSRSKGQKSRSRGGGILWRPPSRTACYTCLSLGWALTRLQASGLVDSIKRTKVAQQLHFTRTVRLAWWRHATLYWYHPLGCALG